MCLAEWETLRFETLMRKNTDHSILTEREKAQIKDGYPIATIRDVRRRLGIGLKESKDIVEDYERQLGLHKPWTTIGGIS